MRFIGLALGSLSLACGSSFTQDTPGGAGGDSGAGGVSAGAGGSGGVGAGGAAGVAGLGGSAGAGGSSSFSSCEVPSDCVVTPKTCCGQCGVATVDDRVAVHRERLGDYRAFVCDGQSACPACVGAPDPHLVATCSGGQCAVIDLRDAGQGCMADKDCKLRINTCCGCGVATEANVVAVTTEGIFEQLCDGSIGDCTGACMELPDFSGFAATCEAGGICKAIRR